MFRMDWNALFRVNKIVETENHLHKMHNTSSSSYQLICPVIKSLVICATQLAASC